jgi:anti-sigma factor RsiW
MLRILRRRDLVCREAVELVTDYLEGVLTGRARIRFERHLAACPHCSEYLAQIRDTVAASGYVDPDALDDHVLTDLVSLYRSFRDDR